MCLGIPGRITLFLDQLGLKMAIVDFGGVQREVCIETLPQAKIGDYVIVHAGFALNILDETDAQETLEALRDIGGLDD